MCGGLGGGIGNNVLGEVISEAPIDYAVLIFCLTNLLIFAISYFSMKEYKVKI